MLVTPCFQQHYVLNMGCVGEHIDWLDMGDMVVGIEQLQVASLGGRVAADIDDALGVGIHDDLDNVWMHACSWWVGDDDIWTTMLCDEVVSEYVFHVACIEEGVVDTIELGVYLGILDGIFYVLYAYDLLCLASHEIGDGACACIEVIDEFVACERGEISCYLVEMQCLLGVGLVE